MILAAWLDSPESQSFARLGGYVFGIFVTVAILILGIFIVWKIGWGVFNLVKDCHTEKHRHEDWAYMIKRRASGLGRPKRGEVIANFTRQNPGLEKMEESILHRPRSMIEGMASYVRYSSPVEYEALIRELRDGVNITDEVLAEIRRELAGRKAQRGY
jgi:hypothetical protein